MATACKATRKNGQPCQAPAGPDGYCFGHSPRLSEARRAGSSRGGQNKRNLKRAERLVPSVLKPVLYKLLHAMVEVDSGRMQPRVGQALAAMAVATVKVYEVSTLEERLERVEQEVRHGVGDAGQHPA